MINHIISATTTGTSNSSKLQGKAESTLPLKTEFSKKDVFVRSAHAEIFPEMKQTTKSLKPDDALALAQKYDVTNMTRNEFNQLLGELRNMGVIGSQDFSAGYGGEIPHYLKEGESVMTYGPLEEPTWPMGNERVDFIKLLRSCADYCSDFAAGQEENSDGRKVGNSLADSYHRLIHALEQIKKAGEENKSTIF